MRSGECLSHSAVLGAPSFRFAKHRWGLFAELVAKDGLFLATNLVLVRVLVALRHRWGLFAELVAKDDLFLATNLVLVSGLVSLCETSVGFACGGLG